ncbi:SusC/RagA family TonB-linked outer membrane protein [Maribellus sediminis]|uniref:SusC/RagA family TonB-linked outer membrane protein n=1 Tax=Maribellus sediminis TaxID=2696285 RepID=UPI0014309B5A|nr:SusC/RagA family TonB-linked outer membrane protein [Maribellus sediminis]
MKKLVLFFVFLCVIGLFSVLAQVKTISGVVTSGADDSPIPGVSVMLKGTTLGTITNIDGEYTLKVPEDGQILVVSFIGMKTQEIAIDGQSTVNIVMEADVFGIDEVVVTGVAGATEKKKLSVSVASVSAEDLEKVPAGSAASALQGKVAGVQVNSLGRPGAGATILLRGAANFYGSNAPLVMMDGVYVEGGLADINVDDIASFEIVKGASASSLYGSRAGNGVIVITSKRGAVGTPQVTVRSEIGFSQVTNFMDVNKSHQYVLADDWENYKGQYTKFEGITYPDNWASVYAASGDQATSGARIEEEDHYADNPFGVYYDFQDLFFKKGTNATEYVSIAGGTEKFKTFFSTEYNKVDGVQKEIEGYSRNTFRFNVDYYINDWLKFSASNNYIKLIDNSTFGDFRTITRISPDANVTFPNPDGQPYWYKADPWDNEVNNPLYNAYSIDAATKQQRFLGGYKLNVKFTDFLNLDAEYSFENNTSRYTSNSKYETYVTSGDEIGFGYSKGGLSKNSSLNVVQKAQATLNFVKQFGELDVKAKLSGLAEDRRYEYFSASGNDYLYKDIASLDNFDKSNISASSNQTAERAQNLFAIAGLVYKDRYIFDGLYRKDGSSLFGENNRWADYFRVSGAYRITQDIDIPGVQELKLSAAHGTAGQRPGFTWQYEMTNLSGGSLSTNRIKGNPDLKPSKTAETEIAISAQFLDRFSLDAAYSFQESTDQFMLVNLFAPANAGKNRQWQNVGNLETNTFELSLNSQIVRSNDWNWDLTVNFTKTTSLVTKLNAAEQFVGPSDNVLWKLKEGTDFGAMYGYKFVHDLETMANQLPDGKTIDEYSINSDGVVVETATIGTVDEKAVLEVDENGAPLSQEIGNQNADWYAGIVSNLSYKNFDFYMLWDYKHGGDIYNRNVQWNVIAGRSAIVDQAGKPEDEKKTTLYYQSLYQVNNNVDFWVEDGTFMKLREISLSYTLRKNQLDGFLNGFFKEFKFSAIGRNVLTFTKYSGWDPEVQAYDGSTQQYFSADTGVYPNQSSYSFSVQFKF